MAVALGVGQAYRPRVVRSALVAAWLCLGTAASGGWFAVRSSHDRREADDSAAHRLPPVRRQADPFSRWTITEQFAAQHDIVIQVETRHLNDYEAIARRIVEPFNARYDEVLIYFHRPGRPDTLPPRRMQWTRRGGYVGIDFDRR